MKRKSLLTLITIILAFGVFSYSHSDNNPPKKTLLIYFSGSDWCPDCIRLEKNVLRDTVFTYFLDHHGITVEQIDFPQRKKLTAEQIVHNETIAEKYDFNGSFPTILLARPDTLKYVKLDQSNLSAAQLMSQIKAKLQELQ